MRETEGILRKKMIQMIIYNGPPPGPTQSPFTTCMARGVYYYPYPPPVPFYINLNPEAGYVSPLQLLK